MKKYFYLLLIALFLSGPLSAKKPVLKSFYQHSVFKIDGEIDDWGDMAIFDEVTSLVSNISNDKEYLYIKIRATSYGAVSRLLMSGFTIWFNSESKNRPQKGLAFPLKSEIAERYKAHNKEITGLSKIHALRIQKSYIEEFNNKFTSGFSVIRIVDNDRKELFYKPSSMNEEGLSALVKLIDMDLLIYEARVPIDLVLDNKEEFLNSSDKSFCIGFEYGKIEIETKSDPTTSMPLHERTSSYTRRNRHQIQDYSEIPALTAWYKKVYLSKE